LIQHILGSHDFSASGKTFLAVLERAGFCKNVHNFEFKEESIVLNPTMHGNVAIYGYAGKKSGMEIAELEKVKFQDAPGLFKIFMLHTTIESARGNVPMPAINESALPYANYYALGHLHIRYEKQETEKVFVYPGPIFPNNFQELEELGYGSFYIVDITNGKAKLEKIELKLKDVVTIKIEIKNALTATETIIAELEKHELADKIVLLRLYGKLEQGKRSDIDFSRIENFVKEKKAYIFLWNASQLETVEQELDLKVETQNMEELEKAITEKYMNEHVSEFNRYIPSLLRVLAMEKQEDEKQTIFVERLVHEAKKVLGLEENVVEKNKAEEHKEL